VSLFFFPLQRRRLRFQHLTVDLEPDGSFLVASRFFPHSDFPPIVHVFLVCFQIFPGPLIVAGMVASHGPAHTYVVGVVRPGRGVLLCSSDDRRVTLCIHTGVKHGNEHDYHRVEQTVSDPQSFEFEQATSNPYPIHLQVTILYSRLCHPVAYSFFFHVQATGRRREVVGGGPG
jgi:hypothetical protein